MRVNACGYCGSGLIDALTRTEKQQGATNLLPAICRSSSLLLGQVLLSFSLSYDPYPHILFHSALLYLCTLTLLTTGVCTYGL